jgi:hypothetical protein
MHKTREALFPYDDLKGFNVEALRASMCKAYISLSLHCLIRLDSELKTKGQHQGHTDVSLHIEALEELDESLVFQGLQCAGYHLCVLDAAI